MWTDPPNGWFTRNQGEGESVFILLSDEQFVPFSRFRSLRVNRPYATFGVVGRCSGFPLGLEKLENLEKWEGIFQSGKSQGILNRLEKSGKTTQNTGKLRKFQKKIICYFSMIFKWTVYYLLKCIKFSVKKILENGKKYWKSQGKVREFCHHGKVGTLMLCK